MTQTDDLPENWRDLDGIGSYDVAIGELRRRHVASQGLIVGIDPGLTGAIAYFCDGQFVSVADMPVLELGRGTRRKREVDEDVLADMLDTVERLGHAFVERQWARPRDGKTQSNATVGHFWLIRGVLAALKIPRTYVVPAVWKKTLSVPAAKDGARARASQLLPSAACNWRRAKDDGRAEAALIALWGLRQ